MTKLDYLLIERSLSGDTFSTSQLNANETDFCARYKPVFDVGLLARRMAQGYYAHAAAIEVARSEDAKALATTPLGQISSYVGRKDGTQHTFDLPYYLNQAHTNPEVVDELPRVWLIGALLSVGDALSDIDYLDKNYPLLELVYHLRNGIAHGNRFHFLAAGRKRLKNHPAHNKYAGVKSATDFEIEEKLQGQKVLFDYMGPGDVLDLLMSVEIFLTRIRERDADGSLAGLLL